MEKKRFRNFRWGLTGEPQEMLVEEGKVVARTPSASNPLSLEERGNFDAGDLDGGYVLPAFIDSHCHILPTGLDLAKLHLGGCSSHEEILDAVRDRHKTLEPGKWLLAVHYDQNRFSGSGHLTREELDAVVPDRPVLLRHSNGHAGVANSPALSLAGVDEGGSDPKGGTYVRDESGRLNGVLLETALERVSAAAPKPNLEEMVEAILAAGDKMAALGISCATDMMAGFLDLETELSAYRIALERGCAIRIRLFLQWSAVLGRRAVRPEVMDEFRSNVPLEKGKIAGLKVFADGAIGSATAAIYGRFLTTEGDQKDDGQLIYAPDRLASMVREAHEAGYSVAVHSIGDRSTDHVLDAFQAVGDASRHRIEHAMLLSDSQIERIARLGCVVTMQPEFLRKFAHAYRRQLPEDRFSRLERFRSVYEAGIHLALNSDRPIVPGDPWVGVQTAECRPEGFDSSENLSRNSALAGYFGEAARANGDAGLMGTLHAGSLADFCVFKNDPLKAAAPELVGRWMGGVRSN